MSFRNQYSGSPWQQGGPPFSVGGYSQNYGGYDDQFQMMNMGYGGGRNQGGGGYGGGGLYGSGGGGMNQMRNVGYGSGGQQSRQWSDRMNSGSRQMSRGQMHQRKRLPPRSPASGPRSKRPNLGSGSSSGAGDTKRVSSSSASNDKKPRRNNREPRDGSKTKGKDGEGDAYNPAEPTDDASDIDLDGYESFKSDEDATTVDEFVVEDEENGSKTADAEEEEAAASTDGEEAKKDDEEKPTETKKPVVEPVKAKKPPICYVCKVKCFSERKYKQHVEGPEHKVKIEELLEIRRGKKPEDKESVDEKDGRSSSKQKVRKPGNWCTVCECIFVGNFLAHRRTKEHRKKRDKKYPKCRPCRLGFSSSEEYRDHYKSEDHKQRSAEFHYLKGLATGSDDDEEATKPAPVEQRPDEKQDVEMKEEPAEDQPKIKAEPGAEEAAKEETVVDNEDGDSVKKDVEKDDEESDKKEEETGKKDAEKKDSKSDAKKSRSRDREPKAQGQSFVISVQGYYCKLCRKFFKDVTVSKSRHCRSEMHITAFKAAMEEAFRQEEERQSLAEEQDRQDREIAEAAELAAEIASIEREAKEAEKRKTAAKKNANKDVEMKDVEVKKEKEEPKSKENGEPASVKTTEDKSAKEIKRESEKEDEVEEEKPKESSPAARRGRGRGRGRRRR